MLERCKECKSRVCEHNFFKVRLSPRERQIVKCLMLGMSNKEMATEMKLQSGTLKVYASKLFKKTGLTSRLELAIWGMRYYDTRRSETL